MRVFDKSREWFVLLRGTVPNRGTAYVVRADDPSAPLEVVAAASLALVPTQPMMAYGRRTTWRDVMLDNADDVDHMADVEQALILFGDYTYGHETPDGADLRLIGHPDCPAPEDPSGA